MRNVYLDREDTNGRDEVTLRGKLHLVLGGDWSADVTAMYVDLDNGYDAFAIDNRCATQADRPGGIRSRPADSRCARHGPARSIPTRAARPPTRPRTVSKFRRRLGQQHVLGRVRTLRLFSWFDRERTTLTEDLRLEGSAADSVEWASRAVLAAPAGGHCSGTFCCRTAARPALRRDYSGDEHRGLWRGRVARSPAGCR